MFFFFLFTFSCEFFQKVQHLYVFLFLFTFSCEFSCEVCKNKSLTKIPTYTVFFKLNKVILGKFNLIFSKIFKNSFILGRKHILGLQLILYDILEQCIRKCEVEFCKDVILCNKAILLSI